MADQFQRKEICLSSTVVDLQLMVPSTYWKEFIYFYLESFAQSYFP